MEELLPWADFCLPFVPFFLSSSLNETPSTFSGKIILKDKPNYKGCNN
jgi:hypothetical protein